MFKVALYNVKRSEPEYLIQRIGADLDSLSLEAYLSLKLKDVEVLVASCVEDIIKFSPDLVGLSAASSNYSRAVLLAGELNKKCGSKVIIGGIHITTCPESLAGVFELGVIGEGEETLLDLVKTYMAGKSGAEIYKNIPGIVFREKNVLVKTPSRSQISNLGALPIPNRKKIVSRLGLPFIMTTRGCPFSCYFCAACKMWDGVRYFPANRVVEEIMDIIDGFHPRAIRFFDDIFTLNKKHVKNVTNTIVREGLTKDVAFTCWSRADLIDKEFVNMLKKANFVNVSMGIESASEDLVSRLKGENFSIKKVQSSIDMLTDAGITVSCTFIIGTPGETRSNLDQTYAFIEKNAGKILDVEINPLIVFPATPVWSYAEKRGLVSASMDWEKLNDTGVLFTFDFDNYIYLNEKMPREEFLQYVEKFTVLYKQINLNEKARDFLNKYFPISSYPAEIKKCL